MMKPHRHLARCCVLLAFAFPLFTPGAQAADVCFDEIVEEDPFSGASTLSLRSWMGTLILDDRGPQLEFPLAAAGAMAQSLPPGFELLLLLDNGTRVILVSDRPAEPSGHAYVTEYSATVSTRWSMHFILSEEAIHAMVQSPIKAIRFTLREEVTIEVEPGRIKDFRNDLACVANRMAAAPSP
jgi:hypothetical protein